MRYLPGPHTDRIRLLVLKATEVFATERVSGRACASAHAPERTSAQIATTQTARDAGMSEAPEALDLLLVGVRASPTLLLAP